ncbi:acyltransferase 3 [Alcanivorax venustensis ISO4]|uniref:Acyltransferase 3 n=1 Tax=Alloalcanivorax venustensis ISO4 TaxID=1177184 RepID=A0ABS0AHN0_9GAMM|nr:acyltransferase 3 [Alloalcanivorax venustensis ISO4]
MCSVPFAWMWMLPSQFKDFSQSLVAISLFSSNILFWRESGYFAPAAEENPMLHTWTLAVEEQFYILFPILLLMLWRFGRDPIFYIIIFISAVSLLFSEYGWRHHPTANFYLLPTRAWELGVGAACAFLLHNKNPTNNSFLSYIGLVMICSSIFLYDETIPFPSLYTLVPVLGVALIILFSSTQSFVTKVLSMRLLVGIGLISFSAYLWHQPMFAFARIRALEPPSLGLMFILSLASLALAYLTWRFIEVPFRKRKGGPVGQSINKVFSVAALTSFCFIAFGLYGHFKNGLPWRESPAGEPFSYFEIDGLLAANNGLSPKCEGGFDSTGSCATGDEPEVMIWGDSYAMHLADAILASEGLGKAHIVQFTKSVCAPIYEIALTNQNYAPNWSNGCVEFNERVKEWLSNNKSIKYVVMSSPMGIIYSDIYYNGEVVGVAPSLVLKKMNETASHIRSLGKMPVFVSPPPRTGHDLSQCTTRSQIMGVERDCSFATNSISEDHKKVMAFLNDEALSVPVIDLSRYFCERDKCKTSSNGIPFYRDKGHLSKPGSSLIGSQFDLFSDIKRAAHAKMFSPKGETDVSQIELGHW